MKKLLLALIALAVVLKTLLPRGESTGPDRDTERDKTGLQPRSGEEGACSGDGLLRKTEPILLDVPHFPQDNVRSWCYAACAQMVIAAYGRFVGQCEIVSFVKDPDCCDNPNLPICVLDGASHEAISAIYFTFDLSATRHEKPNGVIELTELQDELLAGRPVEVTLESTEQSGSFHAVIVRGFSDNWLAVNDPLADDDPVWVTYNRLVNGFYYKWDETWTGLEPLR